MEIGQETIALFIHLLMDWIGFRHGDMHLSYVTSFLLLVLLLIIIIPVSWTIVSGFLGYVLALADFIYRRKNKVPEDKLSHSWHKLRNFLSHYMTNVGKILNAHEIIGMEHLPEGPGLLVYYHGTINTGYIYFVSSLYAQKGRVCLSVLEKRLYYIPGMKTLFDVVGCIRGSKAECVELLKKGYLLGISPGGVREALFSDHYYRLVWGKRIGFAQVALEAKVPIIPMFTQNGQEAFRGFGRMGLTRWLYEKTRIVGVLIYGGFPVKLRTYIGKPIPYNPNITAEELAEKTKIAIENLRDQYQKVPGSILRALSERFEKHPKDN